MTCKNNNFEFYVNIATPFIVEEETLKYIDLDLDFRINGINPGTIKKLDLHEYDENKLKYNYPIEIMKQIEIAEQEIIEMFKTSKFRDLIKLDFAQNKDKE